MIDNDTLTCPDCGGVMTHYSDYTYNNQEGNRIEGNIYHCEKCGHDEVVESTWTKIKVEQRRYFHG